jgi:peptide/nickel transport system ATP-binding protein
MNVDPQPSVILEIRDLTVAFDVDCVSAVGVDGVTIDVRAGEVLAVVGESGSGKSVTAMAVLGLLPDNATTTGSIGFRGRELVGLDEAGYREIRGRKIAMVFQDPQAALNPVFTIGFQLIEAVRHQQPGISRADARSRAVELLEMVEIPDPLARLGYYPHQLSGGQCQRAMIAMALASEPELLIADEPTTALDVTVQAEILDVLRRLRSRLESSILIITHDMGVVADLADRVVVMKNGAIVESNTVRDLFEKPAAVYTRDLLAAVPRIGQRDSVDALDTSELTPALDVRDLVVDYGSRLRGTFRAVDSVSLQVFPSEIVALVGESGSGKTTVGRCAIGLAPISGGSVAVDGIKIGHATRAQTAVMRRKVGVVFQNPTASLNPRYTVEQTIAEPLRVFLGLRGPELSERVGALLESVGLEGDWLTRYTHQLSGGQRQRVSIARAVALDPALLIADEPTSALDVSVQARVLDVFRELQGSLGFACLFISHDLAVVDSLCDRVAVMRAGKLIEYGSREQVLGSPTADYTKRLITSAPVPHPVEQAARREARLAG